MSELVHERELDMKWFVDNGIIKTEDETGIHYPHAEEIFENDLKRIGISLSRLFALNFDVEFVCEDGKINLFITAKKGEKTIAVPIAAGRFIDYLLIENKCYYINPTIDEINRIADKYGIDYSKNLTFFDYINVSRELTELHFSFADQVYSQLDSLKEDDSEEKHTGFTGKLFPYQESGVKWLSFMSDGNCGCILADSMGLGKTLQIILTLGHIKENNANAHFLIISPLSILENWKREVLKFYPSLSCHINHGETNLTYYKDLLDYDVIVTSYGSVQTNFSTYEMIVWDAVVLDEAQNIKNPDAKRTKTVKALSRRLGIAVTGTPFENHITDVWSITDFVLPGYLGSLRDFQSEYEDSLFSAETLEKRISPIMIRRKVEDVAKDLPERIDIPQSLQMTFEEAKYYDAKLKSFEELKTMRMDKIQKLRMFCTHPSVYEEKYIQSDPISISQKYERCCEILEEIVANGEKAIIFTSFNKMIELLSQDLKNRFCIPTDYINGSIEANERQLIIDRFSEIEGAAVLVLNPKAAGAGLNITAANHVIHYNLEWNPAVEDQASARSYRRGQKKTVFVHRLYYLNTIEEVINEKIERKRTLFEAAIVGNEGELNDRDLAKALSLSPLVSEA